MNKKGFTLIELLIVIAIIAILMAVVFVALNPLQRFKDARDASKWQDVDALLGAIMLDQVDNGGTYASAITDLTAGEIYMLGTDGSICNTVDGAGNGVICTTPVTQTVCADLTDGVDDVISGGYVGSIPIVESNATYIWDEGKTGNTIEKSVEGYITIRACKEEGSNEVEITR